MPPKKLSLSAIFGSLPESITQSLADADSPLSTGLAVLAIAQDKAGVDYLSIEEITTYLEMAGVAVKHGTLQKAFARAGNRIATRQIDGQKKHKLMFPGRQLVKEIINEKGKVEILFVEGGKPRTARKTLAEILTDVDGLVRITDPWYGERTLDALELIPKHCRVQFLTAQTNERTDKLGRAIIDFKRERPNVELRVFPDHKELHDRYVLTGNRLLIVGHGIKDIGNKESFVIVVDHSFALNLLAVVSASFDLRWGKATAL